MSSHAQRFHPRLQLALAALVGVACALPVPTLAAKKVVKPALTLKVYKGKRAVGTELLRVKSGEENRYVSTRAKLRIKGRRYVFRTHTVLDEKGAMVTFDRWIDVKGATLRRRVFAFKGAWKHVVFPQPGQKRQPPTDLEHKGKLAVLDPRSPILVSLAADRLVGGAPVKWVDANSAKTGTLALTAEQLVDPAGKRFVRLHLKGDRAGKPVALSVLRDAEGKTLEVTGLDGFSGRTKGFSSANLTAAPGGETPGVPKDPDAPIAPPKGPGDNAKPADAPAKPASDDAKAKPGSAKPEAKAAEKAATPKQ